MFRNGISIWNESQFLYDFKCDYFSEEYIDLYDLFQTKGEF